MYGRSGEDVLIGGDGADRVFGEALADTLYGGGGDDFLSAAGGSDVLFGSTGDDVMDGGIGRDTFVFETGDGSDRIMSWESGRDFIDFSNHASYNSFDDVQAVMTQVGANVRIQIDPETDKILLLDVALESMDASHFLF
ncbi:hypothetical protein L0666_11055 [Octadecabacter sp. CECT 8868]|nr:hypothetical protein [Octadecabacter algicola]